MDARNGNVSQKKKREVKMNKTINIIIGAVLVVLFIVAGYTSYELYEITHQEPVIEKVIEYVYIESDPEVVTEYVYLPSTDEFYRSLTDEDCWYLKDIAMREAQNQGVVGQCWVMYTVLCRAEAFGQSIKEVCESSAFESSRSRSGITPNDDCNEALALIEEGWIPKPLYFRAGKYHNFGVPLCQYKDHYFSTR